MRRDVIALIQAGGAGSRMDVLTRERAKPVLPYAGTHRLVDFPLSSLVHSDVKDVWVSVEYQVVSIDEYLSGGKPWDLDRSRGGFRRIVPQTGSGPPTEQGFAAGNGDLLLRNVRALQSRAPEHVIVLSADHVFAEDLAALVDEHVESGADLTMVTAEVSRREASENVIVRTDTKGRVTAVEEKPTRPDTGTVATEIFVYRTDTLIDTLRDLRRDLQHDADAEDGDSGLGDFSEHLVPRLIEQGDVRAVPVQGYWRDVGRPGAYLQSHRDLLAGRVDVFEHRDRPVITKWEDRTAALVRPGAQVADSLLSPGAEVAGTVVGSVIGPGAVVERGAHVEDSVIFGDVVVRRGARVHTTVLDERCEVRRGAVVGAKPRGRVARDEDLVVVGRDAVCGGELEPGARLEPGTRC